MNFGHAIRWLHSKRSKIEGNICISKNNALDGLSYSRALSALRTTVYYGVGENRHIFLCDGRRGLRGFNAGEYLVVVFVLVYVHCFLWVER